MSSILSFDIISVVTYEVESEGWAEAKAFLCILSSAADTAAVNPNKINLVNVFIKFSINGNNVFIIWPRSLPRNSRDCIILDNRAFDSLISVDDLPTKALRRFTTCVLVNNNLRRKLVSSLELPVIFDDYLKTASVSFFVANFNLLSCEFDTIVNLNYCIKPFYINEN